MKDPQAPALAPAGHIWLISPLLHFLAMPAMVFWRFNFGYAFLSPKSIFLSSIFATGLLSYIVWHEPDLGPRYTSASIFLLAASAMYCLHLLVCFTKESRKVASHDQYSGSSVLLIPFKESSRETMEAVFHSVVEPMLTMIASLLFRSQLLKNILLICGVALALKELIRWWLSTRKEKRLRDNLDDAKTTMDLAAPSTVKPVSATGRTRRERLPRNSEADSES